MNEKIKSIALECYNPYGNFDLEKFAQLMVRECIEICNQHPSKILKKEWNADVVAWDITQRIKGRFGVEE